MIDEQLAKLAESGILGILLVLSIMAMVFLYKEYKAERDARLADLKAYSNEDKKFLHEIKITLQQILDSIKGAK